MSENDPTPAKPEPGADSENAQPQSSSRDIINDIESAANKGLWFSIISVFCIPLALLGIYFSNRAIRLLDQYPECEGKTSARRKARAGRLIGWIFVWIVIVLFALTLVASIFWWRSTFIEGTDDARVDGRMIQISPRIAGRVIKVNVEENQAVNQGDVIVELDPRDFQVAVENDEAALARAQAELEHLKTGPQHVTVLSSRSKQAEAQVEQVQTQLEQAKLNLGYTHIVAPAAGVITNKSVEINQDVWVGQNLMTLVLIDGLWVTANFKETQLRHMAAGQPVEIIVDATGKTYHGRVTQIGGATGSVLSLFLPENATGNHVKVVQRVPVRIDFTDLKSEDPNHALRPGLSVEPKVRVK
jgi:multidrug resistance efflux pump